MSFIGLVTQKEQRNGVYLQAKVIAPNKALAKTANFKVVVEPIAEDDYMLCVIDNARARSRINVGAGDINDIQSDLDEYLVKAGIHKTITEYTFYNMAGNAKFSDYMTSDGKLIGRPKYGEDDVSGSLELHTYKKDGDGNITAEVTTHITLTIKPLTADQVLDSEEFTKQAVWDKMVLGTLNDKAAQLGWERVRDNLKMAEGFESSYMKEGDTVRATWKVVDSLETTPRVDNTGKIANKMAYDSASDKYNEMVTAGKSASCTFVKDSIGTYLYYTFKGITITCTLSLGEETRTIVYECAMQSSPLTNTELLKKIYDKLRAEMGNSGGAMTFGGENGADASKEQSWLLTEDTFIRLMKNCRGIAIPEYQIDGASLYPITQSITYSLKTADGTSPYAYSNAITGYEENADNYKYDITKSKLTNEDSKNFTIQADIACMNYNGNAAYGKSFLRLKLNVQ